jgi:hypothetical protein
VLHYLSRSFLFTLATSSGEEKKGKLCVENQYSYYRNDIQTIQKEATDQFTQAHLFYLNVKNEKM